MYTPYTCYFVGDHPVAFVSAIIDPQERDQKARQRETSAVGHGDAILLWHAMMAMRREEWKKAGAAVVGWNGSG